MYDKRKLQLEQIKILKYVDSLCKKNNINYFLIGGTLLGAIRHDGFIPWDDDLDIGLLREEYEKLIDILKKDLSEEYYLQNMENDDCAYIFSKIRKNNTLCQEKYAVNVDEHQGIFIDIFCFDKIPNNTIIAKINYSLIQYYRYLLIIKFNFLLNEDSFIIRVAFYIAKFLSLFYSKNFLKKRIIKLKQKYENKDYIWVDSHCEKKFCRRLKYEDAKKIEYHKFEGEKFPIPSNAKDYLTKKYGDFMKIPPIEKTQNYHNYEKVIFDLSKESKKDI